MNRPFFHPPRLAAGALLVAILGASGCALVDRHPEPESLVGTWTLGETDQETNLTIFPGGQCVLIGDGAGAQGLRGFHRPVADGVICVFENGRALALARRRETAVWTPDALQEGRSTWSKALPVDEPRDRFVGAWRLNPEPEGGHLYVQLLASGIARSSLGEITGKWIPWNGGALCTWPGGWRDWIAPGGPGFLNRSWPPGAPLTADPSDTVVARHVGASPFSITP